MVWCAERPRRSALLLAVVAVATVGCGETTGNIVGNREVTTETRTVPGFDSLRADNGVEVELAVDTSVGGDIELEATAESNLIEYLKTEVSGSTLRATVDPPTGGVSSNEGFEVAATVGRLEDVTVENGAVVDVVGLVDDLALSADNGAVVAVAGSATELDLDADNGAVVRTDSFEAGTVRIDADNGAVVTICATGAVVGKVTNGAVVTVRCGGDTSGVSLSNGGVLG